jgi:hypothetical protein
MEGSGKMGGNGKWKGGGRWKGSGKWKREGRCVIRKGECIQVHCMQIPTFV